MLINVYLLRKDNLPYPIYVKGQKTVAVYWGKSGPGETRYGPRPTTDGEGLIFTERGLLLTKLKGRQFGK